MKVKVMSIEHLKSILSKGGPQEFSVTLGKTGQFRSRKVISKTKDKNLYYIMNMIDESEQELTEEQLSDPIHSIVGKAINKGALYHEPEEKEGHTIQMPN